jgi:serine/threonine protein kinase
LSKWKSGGEIHTSSGSPYYLAPEVINGVKTTKSDIWSIGVLLYTLLSGNLPFVGDSHESIQEKALEDDISFDTRIWTNISREVRELLQLMMEKDYTERVTAKQCLSHEWFAYALSDKCKNKSQVIKDSVASNMYAFIKK